MRSFIKGMVLGAAVAAAALVGYAYGSSTAPAEGSQTEANQAESGRCDVQVGFGRMTAGSECRFDQVMVGVRSEYILCADVEVQCP